MKGDSLNHSTVDGIKLSLGWMCIMGVCRATNSARRSFAATMKNPPSQDGDESRADTLC